VKCNIFINLSFSLIILFNYFVIRSNRGIRVLTEAKSPCPSSSLFSRNTN